MGYLNIILGLGRVIYFNNVQFQKISMPTPRKVNGNSKGEGGFRIQFFERKYDTNMEFLEGCGGSILKSLPCECECEYFINPRIVE